MNETSQNNVSEPWLTPKEAAQHLKCSIDFLNRDRMTRLHGVPFARLGSRIRYRRSDLDAFLAKQIQ